MLLPASRLDQPIPSPRSACQKGLASPEKAGRGRFPYPGGCGGELGTPVLRLDLQPRAAPPAFHPPASPGRKGLPCSAEGLSRFRCREAEGNVKDAGFHRASPRMVCAIAPRQRHCPWFLGLPTKTLLLLPASWVSRSLWAVPWHTCLLHPQFSCGCNSSCLLGKTRLLSQDSHIPLLPRCMS